VPVRNRRVVAALLAAGLAILFLAGRMLVPRMQPGTGVVLDTTTDQPVPDAEVTLDCQRGTGFHTTEQVRLARTRTDAAGQYRFEDADVAGCEFGFVRAAKSGYTDAGVLAPRYAYTGYDRIPPVRYLTPDADVDRVQLTSLDSGPRLHAPPNESAAHEYDRLFDAFYASKWIASSEEDTRWVIERYCARMSELYDQMSEADRRSVGARSVSYEAVHDPARAFHMAPRDHATEVLPYCRSGGAIKSPYEYRFTSSTSCLVVLQEPTRLRNANCGSAAVHVTVAFKDAGAGVESATLAAGEEFATRTQGDPRTAECPAGWIAVTAAGQPWNGIEYAVMCRRISPRRSSS